MRGTATGMAMATDRATDRATATAMGMRMAMGRVTRGRVISLITMEEGAAGATTVEVAAGADRTHMVHVIQEAMAILMRIRTGRIRTDRGIQVSCC